MRHNSLLDTEKFGYILIIFGYTSVATSVLVGILAVAYKGLCTKN